MADILGDLWLSTVSSLADLLNLGKDNFNTLDPIFTLHSHLTFTGLVLACTLLQLVSVRN